MSWWEKMSDPSAHRCPGYTAPRLWHQAGLFVSNNSPPWGMPTWTFNVLFRNVKTETQRDRGSCIRFQEGATLTKLFAFVLSRIRLFAASWTVARQDPLPLEFSRQEYWSGLPFPPPGDLPNPGIKPVSPASPALAGRFFITSTNWEALFTFKQELFPFQSQ